MSDNKEKFVEDVLTDAQPLSEAQRQIMMHALQGGTFEFLTGRKGPYIQFIYPKHHAYPCPTDNCPGHNRYVPPGRGHLTVCTYLKEPKDALRRA